MSLEISHYDVNNFDIYAILYNSDGDAFSIVTSGFESYNDIQITGFAISLPENTGRLGFYNTTINEFVGFDKGQYSISVYRQIGAGPDKSSDKLRASALFNWNGTTTIDNLQLSSLSEIYAGTAYMSGDMGFMARFKDEFGFDNNNNNNINYAVYYTGAITSITGVMSNVATGLYFGSISITNSIFNNQNQYSLYISTKVGNENIGSIHNFTIEELPVDNLGYVEGRVLVGSTSGIIANLTSSTNDIYNGSILRMKNGTLRGHARIVFDYNGTTKFVRFNNLMVGSPSSGDKFVIYPIGGELNI